GLVLGVTAIIAPLPFSQTVLRAELPWLIGATVLALVLLFDVELDFWDGFILLTGLAIILYLLIHTHSNSQDDAITGSITEELDDLPDMTNAVATTWLLVGLAILVASAQLLVWSRVGC
ncbi:MAG: calcium/sodium antiporter, partial [Proteobacteria bacterium]|nr:calcium/sodium antiporter [Pseudomonadota bacterium]